MPEVFEPGALNYYLLSRLILSILSISRNPTLTHLPLSRFLDSLLSDCTYSRSGIFSFDDPHANGGVIIFVRQGSSVCKLFAFSVSSLDPYSNYVGISSLLNNFYSLSLLMFVFPLFALRRIAEPTPFFLQKFSIWRTSTAITHLGLERYFSLLWGKSI